VGIPQLTAGAPQVQALHVAGGALNPDIPWVSPLE
jgi:hypothetical protein